MQPSSPFPAEQRISACTRKALFHKDTGNYAAVLPQPRMSTSKATTPAQAWPMDSRCRHLTPRHELFVLAVQAPSVVPVAKACMRVAATPFECISPAKPSSPCRLRKSPQQPRPVTRHPTERTGINASCRDSEIDHAFNTSDCKEKAKAASAPSEAKSLSSRRDASKDRGNTVP